MYYRGKGGIRSYKIKYIYKYCRHYLKHVLWAHNINALKIYILVWEKILYIELLVSHFNEMNLVFDFQVFTGNSNTCMKISGNQVQRIMTLVAKNKEKVPQFLDLLNAVVKVEELDLPLKRNQSFVMQYFMQFRSDIANVIDQDEAAR